MLQEDPSVPVAENKCNVVPQSSIPYFKHFVNALKSRVESGSGNKLICFSFSEDDFKELSILLADADVSEKRVLDRVLDSLLASVQPDPTIGVQHSFGAIFAIWPMCVFGAGIVVITILVVYMSWTYVPVINWYRSAAALFIMCFLASIPWEWQRMYKEALAKKSSTAIQDVPASCRPRSLWVAIPMWFREQFSFQEDPCIKYYEAILVDPFWEVTPFQALATCLSRFFVQPIEVFAEAAGKAFRLYFSSVPTQWMIPVFIVTFVLIIVIIISISGFEVSTPLLRIGVRPGHGPSILEIKNRELQAQIVSYQERILQLQSEKSLMLKERVEDVGDVEDLDCKDAEILACRSAALSPKQPRQAPFRPIALSPVVADKAHEDGRVVRFSGPDRPSGKEIDCLDPLFSEVYDVSSSDGIGAFNHDPKPIRPRSGIIRSGNISKICSHSDNGDHEQLTSFASSRSTYHPACSCVCTSRMVQRPSNALNEQTHAVTDFSPCNIGLRMRNVTDKVVPEVNVAENGPSAEGEFVFVDTRKT